MKTSSSRRALQKLKILFPILSWRRQPELIISLPDFGNPDFGNPDFGNPDFGNPDRRRRRLRVLASLPLDFFSTNMQKT